MALIKFDSASGRRVVLLTVSMVALAGLVVSIAAYIHTQRVVHSYNAAMQTELRQKGLAYGQTTQSLLDVFASISPDGFQKLLAVAADDPGAILTTFNAAPQGDFENVPLGYKVWVQDGSAPTGYTLLFQQDNPNAPRAVSTDDPGIRAVVSETAVTGNPSTRAQADNKDIHYAFVLQVNPETRLIISVVLDATAEFEFFADQRQQAIMTSIFLAIGSIAFVAVVGGVLSFLVSRTLTNRKRAEDALRDSELRYRTLASMAPVGIFRMDAAGNNIYSNDRTLESMGVSSDPAQAEAWMEFLHPDDRERVTGEWAEARIRGNVWSTECRFLRPDGSVIWVLGQVAPERNIRGDVIGYVGTITDITTQKHMEEDLREQASRDRLTGTLNHVTIVEELQLMIAAGTVASCAVAMIDIDDMKSINDTYGHQMGDLSLITVAHTLNLRGAVVGRYGGDEFLALLPGAGRAEASRYRLDVIQRLSETKLRDPDTGAQIPLAVTLGLSVYPDEAQTIVQLIKLADGAMYGQRRERRRRTDAA